MVTGRNHWPPALNDSPGESVTAGVYYSHICILFLPGICRDVTKISSYRVNTCTTSRQGIKQLGIIFFGSIFLLFFYESCRGPRS